MCTFLFIIVVCFFRDSWHLEDNFYVFFLEIANPGFGDFSSQKSHDIAHRREPLKYLANPRLLEKPINTCYNHSSQCEFA